MIDNARCGALFSHGRPDPEDDEIHCEILGLLAARVSGIGWNPSAFADEDYPIPVCVARIDVQNGMANRGYMKGDPRPTHWPAPLPMVERVWKLDEPPRLAPDFGAVAEAFARQMRESVRKAILEETDATPEQVESVIGGVARLPNQAAKHFARQEHPIFGAGQLSAQEKRESMAAMDVARMAWVSVERGAIERAAAFGKPAAKGVRI